MGILKSHELDNTGVTGEYWKLIQNNNDDDKSVVTLVLYQSQVGRNSGKNALDERVQFIFTLEDHPLSEFDVDTLDMTLVDDFAQLEKHVRYQHIMNIASIAKAIEDANVDLPIEEQTVLSGNESKALTFYGGVHV